MHEYPPILRGTEAQQIAALREYLVRLASRNDTAAAPGVRSPVPAADRRLPAQYGQTAAAARSTKTYDAETDWEELKARTGRLRSLIVKTAEELSELDELLSVQILSSEGNIFKNGEVATRLRAVVRRGDDDVTDSLPDSAFRWTRVSADREADARWNARRFGAGRSLSLTGDDVDGRATFFCEVEL